MRGRMDEMDTRKTPFLYYEDIMKQIEMYKFYSKGKKKKKEKRREEINPKLNKQYRKNNQRNNRVMIQNNKRPQSTLTQPLPNPKVMIHTWPVPTSEPSVLQMYINPFP